MPCTRWRPKVAGASVSAFFCAMCQSRSTQPNERGHIIGTVGHSTLCVEQQDWRLSADPHACHQTWGLVLGPRRGARPPLVARLGCMPRWKSVVGVLGKRDVTSGLPDDGHIPATRPFARNVSGAHGDTHARAKSPALLAQCPCVCDHRCDDLSHAPVYWWRWSVANDRSRRSSSCSPTGRASSRLLLDSISV